MLTLRLSPDLEERLAAVAERTGRTKTTIVREAIAAKIDYLEELAAAEAALHAAFQDGGEPLERIKQALGLDASAKNSA